MTATRSRRRGGEGSANASNRSARQVDYRNLTSPMPLMNAFSEDRAEAIHEASLRVLEELGIRVLLTEARQLFKAGGARVDETTEMV